MNREISKSSLMNKIFKYALFLFVVLGILQKTVHAQYTENNVNLSTGNYQYYLPLMEVPYNGGSYPIGVSYNSGIVMDQISGMIGLGWDFGVGSILRTVKGFPDDWKNKRVYDICRGGTLASAYAYTTYPTIFNNYLFKYITRPQKNVSKEYSNIAGPLYFESVRSTNGNSCNSGNPYIPNGLIPQNFQSDNYVMDTKWAYTEITDLLLQFSTYAVDDNRNTSVMPDYDNYYVSAANLSGSISPKILEYANLTGENNNNLLNNYRMVYGTGTNDNITKPTSQIYFYFNNEPTSSAKINIGKWVTNGANQNPLNDFTNEVNNNSDNINTFGPVYNDVSKRKGSAKYIEYFTNKEIIENISDCRNRGFIETADIVNRNNQEMFDYDGIGAFCITNENGQTYHFSLPVYQFEEVLVDKYTFNSNDYYIEHQNLNKYAYTWLLTSITGPDYEDSNNNHLVDIGDKGYWVKFSYGKWTDGYVWKTPYNNNTTFEYNLNLVTSNNTHQQYSWGRKQLYYLNSLQTNTHTALFVKSIKKDDLGCVGGQFDNNYSKTMQNENIDECDGFLKPDGSAYSGITSGTCSYSTNFIMPEKHQLLKLDKIILVKNEDLANLSITNPDGYPLISPVQSILNINCQINNGNTSKRNYSKSLTCYYQNNVLDNIDIEHSDIISKSIKVIELKQGYYLCYSTPNSNASSSEPIGPPNPDAYEKGKLTLYEIYIKGLGGATIMPSYKFDYVKHNNLYNFNRQDYWGYDCGDPANKSDGNVNKSSYVDNWSLNKILTPIGSEISISYESKKYTLEAANLVENNALRYGGGVAVNEIQIKDENNKIYKTTYGYSNGATTYSPSEINNRCFVYLNYLPSAFVRYKNVSVTNKNAEGLVLNSTLYEYMVPGRFSLGTHQPNGAYFSISMNCFTMTQTPSIPSTGEPNRWSYGITPQINIYARKIMMYDNSSSLGRIEKITYMAGNYADKVIKYNYLDYDPMPSNSPEIGKVKETFKNKKLCWNDIYYNQWYLTTSSYESAPNILESITVLSKGNESTQYFDLTKYDYNLGRCLETHNDRVNQNNDVKSQTILAYTAYPGMGSKVLDINNKNILSPEIGVNNYVYCANVGIYKPTSVNVSTWSNIVLKRTFNNNANQPRYEDLFINGGNWHPYQSFTWKGEVDHVQGFFNNFVEFNYNNINSNYSRGWLLDKEISIFDDYANPLEYKDIHNVYSSSKNDNNDATNYVIANCNGASYKNFTYTGFETKKLLLPWLNDFGAEVMGNQQNESIDALATYPILPHTGNSLLKIKSEWGPGFQIIWNFLNNDLPYGKTYRASVWVHTSSNSKICLVADLSGATRKWDFISLNNSKVQIGDWKLLNIEFLVPTDFLPNQNNEISLSFYVWNTLSDLPSATGSSTPYLVNEPIPYSNQYFSYIDDFIVAPVDAVVSGSVYDLKTGLLIGSTNNDGYGTKYEYDNAGRLIAVKKETKNGFIKTMEKQYHFGRQQ